MQTLNFTSRGTYRFPFVAPWIGKYNRLMGTTRGKQSWLTTHTVSRQSIRPNYHNLALIGSHPHRMVS
jgi:hypothetical protein